MIELLICSLAIPLIYYLLFLLFDLLGLKKLALFALASSDAPFFGFNSKKIVNYCTANCKEKKCKNCKYWTCEYYIKDLDKEDKL